MADRYTKIRGNQIRDLTVTSDDLASNAVTTAKITNDAVDKDKIAADVAGAGLVQAVGGELDVNVDDSSIEINSDVVRVKASGITNDMLAGSIAFSKMVDLTASRALVSDVSGDVSVSSVTSTELGYLSGVTSGIQSQLDAVSSGYNRRQAVINIVDNTEAPPTEVTGDRYILDFTAGGVHADWDSASAGDIVEFNGTTWDAVTPSEGYVAYVDTLNVDALYVDDGTPTWETRNVQSSALADGKIWIGNVSDVAAAQTMSGDVTITNAGVTSIGNDKVVTAKIADGNVTAAKLDIVNAEADGYYLMWSTSDNKMKWSDVSTTGVLETDLVQEVTEVGVGGQSDFVIANDCVTASLQVFLNGMLLLVGSGKDYTYTSGTKTVALGIAAEEGDIVVIHYIKASV